MEDVTKQHIETLWNKYLNNAATQEELQQLLLHINNAEDAAADWDFMEQGFANEETIQNKFVTLEEEQKRQLVQNVFASIHTNNAPVRPVHSFAKVYWAAASLLLIVLTVTYIWHKNTGPDLLSKNITPKETITPTQLGAILTLADGTQLALDSAGNNTLLAHQNGADVKINNGELTYDLTNKIGAKLTYNTMTTPKGRQYIVVLPDATKVWLNAATTIRYPTAFTGSAREIELTGEAYFEVSDDKTKPFRIKINATDQIEVLGTHFNVNAYSNEKTWNTTLLEGAVSVSNGPEKVIIKPGQQAQIGVATIQVLNNIDLDKIMAWKEGLFNFEGATLEQVLKQLERWYDIEVVYDKEVPMLQFFGKMSNDLSLNDMLMILKRSKVNFKLEGKKLIIFP